MTLRASDVVTLPRNLIVLYFCHGYIPARTAHEKGTHFPSSGRGIRQRGDAHHASVPGIYTCLVDDAGAQSCCAASWLAGTVLRRSRSWQRSWYRAGCLTTCCRTTGHSGRNGLAHSRASGLEAGSMDLPDGRRPDRTRRYSRLLGRESFLSHKSSLQVTLPHREPPGIEISSEQALVIAARRGAALFPCF